MSARTCLLCGKTLSRIWAGSGDDFCSREHRNQYRLRRGMDRLMEANKVASVGRRRENPLPVDRARLMQGGPQTPRDFSQPQPFPIPAAAASLPCPAPACSPRLCGHGPLQPFLARSGEGQSLRACPAPLAMRSTAPVVMVLTARAPRAIPQAASPLVLARGVGLAARVGREMPAPPPRAATEAILRGLPRATASPLEGMAKSRPARSLVLARGGRDLRVSMAARFRIPDWKLRSIVFAAPAAAGFTWPAFRLKGAALSSPGGPDYPRPRIGPAAVTALTVKPEKPAMWLPVVAPPDFEGGLRWPGIIDFPPVITIPAAGYRVAAAPFGDENPTKERFHEYRN